MTLGKLYKKTIFELSSISPTPDLDTRVLFEHALSRDSAYFLAHPDMPLTNPQYAKINRLINRRKKGEPIAYITGHKEFYGYDFSVNKNVLVPRPESEWLVEEALPRVEYLVSCVKENRQILNTKYYILDIGTGSGCIIISLVSQLVSESVSQYLHFYASDISKKALGVAKNNAKKHGISEKIKFVHSDLFSNRLIHKKFDLIIANLPYVPNQVKSQKLKVKNPIDFEPSEAIFAKENGAQIIKKFLNEARNYLARKNQILIELDPRNASEIQKIARTLYPKSEIILDKDLAKRDRYLIIKSDK